VLGLLVYLLPLYLAVPRSGLPGVGDRAPGIVVARHRQAPFDVAAEDRPLARPPAVAPTGLAAVLAPGPDGRPGPAATGGAVASRRAAPGRPRSPPAG
jgi:hypothetical protein